MENIFKFFVLVFIGMSVFVIFILVGIESEIKRTRQEIEKLRFIIKDKDVRFPKNFIGEEDKEFVTNIISNLYKFFITRGK